MQQTNDNKYYKEHSEFDRLGVCVCVCARDAATLDSTHTRGRNRRRRRGEERVEGRGQLAASTWKTLVIMITNKPHKQTSQTPDSQNKNEKK